MKISDYIKANRKGSRNAELENQTGWCGSHKIHSTPKNYSRKIKHKKCNIINQFSYNYYNQNTTY